MQAIDFLLHLQDHLYSMLQPLQFTWPHQYQYRPAQHTYSLQDSLDLMYRCYNYQLRHSSQQQQRGHHHHYLQNF